MKISDYSFGQIAIDGKTYTSDVIIATDKVTDNWWRKQGHSLHIDDLKTIVNANPDMLIIGTGYYGRMDVPEKTREYLTQKGIEVRQAKTGEAVKLFNELQKECAHIVAAFHLTC